MLRRLSKSRCAAKLLLASQRAELVTVPMPALSPTMTQGSITEWKKKVGDRIEPGQQFCQVETDKAAVPFNNTSEEGYIARILVEPGTTVPVGRTIALLVDEQSEIASDEVKNWKEAADGAAPPAGAPAPPAEAEKQAAQSTAKPTAASSSGRVLASPLAKVTAKEKGVNLAEVVGTGGTVGRIVKDDVLRFVGQPKPVLPAAVATPVAPAPAQPAPPQVQPTATYVDLPITSMRRTIAARLTQSKNVDAPHYYETMNCNVDNMSDLIKHLNKKGDGKYKITVNDFLIKAIARCNLLVPQCNTHWNGDTLRQYKTVDVSVAVATPTGLITPIIRDAQSKGLVAISNEVKELAKKAKEGALQPNEYQGGTVTISNLGGMGIHNFTAIINAPQSMILAVGTIRPEAEIVTNAEGEYEATGKITKVMSFTASFDHRVVDGAVGAEWFKHFKDTVENPLSLLL